MIKPISFSPDHLISDDGVVYSKRFQRPLSHFKDKDGYVRTHITNNSTTKQWLVHRLVAKEFINNPNDLPQVHHKNGDRSDNRADNLEWVSQKENIARIRNCNKKCPCCGFEFI